MKNDGRVDEVLDAIKQALKLIMIVDMRGDGSNLLEEAEAILTARLTPDELLGVEYDAQNDFAGRYLPPPVRALTTDNQVHLGLGISQPSASLHDPHGVISSRNRVSWWSVAFAGVLLGIALGAVSQCTKTPARVRSAAPGIGAPGPGSAAAGAALAAIPDRPGHGERGTPVAARIAVSPGSDYVKWRPALIAESPEGRGITLRRQ
jgi:hypothetical protein